ncbi:MAG: dihydrolipoyl dehydrogenase, partial [Chlamydiae bacterium]|nr:dihydrolipoyl dehydrogenase [Chlamydiota bacterium]
MQQKFDLIVIGSGPGGYVAAIKAAQLGLKTACVEKSSLGGTCLNVGCIPSKALLQSSEFYDKIAHEASLHGIQAPLQGLDFDKMMQRKTSIVKGFNTGIEALFKKNQVTKIQGHATFISPQEIQVGAQIFSATSFILATGSEPTPLPFLPFDEEKVLSSTGALSLKKIPKKLLVIGAGIIGVELGSVYKRLGSEVIFLEFMDRICPTLDKALSVALQKSLEKQGLQFLLGAKVTQGGLQKDKVVLTAEISSQERAFEADAVLVAIGRKPYTHNLGLEKAQISLSSKGLIPIDNNFRTSQPHILAIGDVVDGPMLAHKAEEEGLAAAELLAGHHSIIEYTAIPSVVYTHPEVAAVGFTEEEAKKFNLSIKVAQFPFKANSRAACMGEGEGFIKILAKADSLQILGVHILGPH